MAVIFKYKEPLNRTYAPGYAKSGVDGINGCVGSSGNTVYFVKKNLDNSYEIKNVLQKLEYNYILDDTKNEPLINREYKIGDLIISDAGNIYRIISSNENSLFNNYKFDIETIGVLNKKRSKSLTRVTVFDLSDCYVYNGKTAIKSYTQSQNKIEIFDDSDSFKFAVQDVLAIYWPHGTDKDEDIEDASLYERRLLRDEDSSVIGVKKFNPSQDDLLVVPYIDPLDTDYFPYLVFKHSGSENTLIIAGKPDCPEFNFATDFAPTLEIEGVYRPFINLNGGDIVNEDESITHVDGIKDNAAYTLVKKFFINVDKDGVASVLFQTNVTTGNFAIDPANDKFHFERTYNESTDTYNYSIANDSSYASYIIDQTSDIWIRTEKKVDIQTGETTDDEGNTIPIMSPTYMPANVKVEKFFIDSSMQVMLTDGRLLKKREYEFTKFSTDIQLGKSIKDYSIITKTCLPSYRTEKPYSFLQSEKYANYDIAGAWFKMIGEAEAMPFSEYSPYSGLDGISYSLVIEMENTKRLGLRLAPATELLLTETSILGGAALGSSFNFYKRLEFPNMTCVEGDIVSGGWGNKKLVNILFNEVKPKYNVSSTYTYDTSPELKDANIYDDIPLDEFNYNLSKCLTTYLSDYTMDDLHPSGNEIKCTISADRDMWLKSGINSEVVKYYKDNGIYHTPSSLINNSFNKDDAFDNDNIRDMLLLDKSYYKSLSVGIDKPEENIYNDNITGDPVVVQNVINDNDYTSLQTFGAGMKFTPIDVKLYTKKNGKKEIVSDSSSSKQFDPEWFPSYAIGLSVSSANEDDLQAEFNNKTWVGYRSFVDKDYDKDVKEKYTHNIYNLGASIVGKSLYGFEHAGYPFDATNIVQYPYYPSSYSVMPSASSTGYVSSYKAKNYKAGNSLYFSGMADYHDVADNIFNYVSNIKNRFISVYRDHKTREMSMKEVPVIFNTALKDSSVFLWFDNNVDTKEVDITAICITDKQGYIKTYTRLV